MSKYAVMCVRDRCAAVFMRPFVVPTVEVGIRSFGDQVRNDKEGAMHMHPSDFELCHLGTWSDGDALFTTGVPQVVARAEDMLIGIK